MPISKFERRHCLFAYRSKILIRDLIYSILENAINQALKLDPDTQKRLMSLEGKVIKIVITDWGMEIYAAPKKDKVYLYADWTTPPDATIRGSLGGLFRVAVKGASGVSLFEQGVQVEGDIELGEQLREIIRQLDLDWEGSLAKILGDSVTHAIAWRAKKVIAASKRTTANLAYQHRDYWQFEKNYLPVAEQVEAFYKDIDQLKEDVDRAEARLLRLEKKFKIHYE